MPLVRTRRSRVLLARTAVPALLLFPGGAPASPSTGAEERLLFDFEDEALTRAWSASGAIRASRVEAPEREGSLEPNRGLAIEAGPGGLLTARDDGLRFDWSDVEALSFLVHRSPAEVARRDASVLEVRLAEADEETWFWRKVVIAHEGWERVRLPLRYFRWRSPGRIPDWGDVEVLSIRFRDAADLVVDDVRVEDEETGPGAAIPLAELSAVAFPDGHAVRTSNGAEVEILTDAPELDLELLRRHLDDVQAMLRRLLPSLGRPAIPPRLVVFRSDADYRAFTPRFASRFAAAAGPPRSAGFTLCGVATASWSDAYGTLRPTYTHEFVHSWLARAAGLQNQGEWLQEGLASHVQLAFHPQANFDALVRQGLADPGARLPLSTLLNGERIPLVRYWQALTVVRFLAESPSFAPRFEPLVDALRAAGSTDVAPHLGPILRLDGFDALEREWREWCATTYGEDAGAGG